MRLTKTMHRLVLILPILLLAVLFTACAGDAAPTPTTEGIPFVQPISTARPEMELEGPDDNIPCGIAEVGWGYRVFNVGNDFPQCVDQMPDLTVYCLTGEATWSQINVSDVDVSTQTDTITFEVRQDGICGLFPADDSTSQ